MDNYKKLLESGILSDVTFSVGEEQKIFKAHKCILAIRSPVFLAMFDGKFKESSTTGEETRIKLPDSTPSYFKEFLEYIYLDTISVNEDNWAPILYLADKYDLPELKKMSLKFVLSNCDEYNACHFYSMARMHSVFSHVGYIKFFIAMNDASLKSTSFLKIDNNQILCEIISMEEQRSDEVTLFRAAIRWASSKIPGEKKDGPELRKVLGPALYAIRFPRIPTIIFEKEVMPSGILLEQEIIGIFCKRNCMGDGLAIDFPSHSRIPVACCLDKEDIIKCIIKVITKYKNCEIIESLTNSELTESFTKYEVAENSLNFQVDCKVKIYGYLLPSMPGEGKISLKSGNGKDILVEQNIDNQHHLSPFPFTAFYFDSPISIEPSTLYTASIKFDSSNVTYARGFLDTIKETAKETVGEWTFIKNTSNMKEGQIPLIFYIPTSS